MGKGLLQALDVCLCLRQDFLRAETHLMFKVYD